MLPRLSNCPETNVYQQQIRQGHVFRQALIIQPHWRIVFYHPGHVKLAEQFAQYRLFVCVFEFGLQDARNKLSRSTSNVEFMVCIDLREAAQICTVYCC